MRRLFSIIFQLVAAAIFFFLCTAAWIIFDGLNDSTEKADVGLVTGHEETPPGMHGLVAPGKLDRAIQLYNDGDFPFIVVSGSALYSGYDSSKAMAEYLVSKGIPAGAIIEGPEKGSTQETAREIAKIMKSHQFRSVMIVSDYYRMTRTKLALVHAGITEVGKAHVGKLRKEDAWKIGREVVALYDYVGKVYLFPAAEMIKKEAQVGMDKASVDAEKARDSVSKGLDNMTK